MARKIRMTLEIWDRVRLSEQEQIMGQDKRFGAPLSVAEPEAEDEFEPLGLSAQGEDGPAIPEDSHVAIVAPESNGGHRMLRRGYNYTDGNDSLGRLDAGLFFIALTRDPRTGFYPILERMTQKDALTEYLQHVGSALFAVPPGMREGDTWWASGSSSEALIRSRRLCGRRPARSGARRGVDRAVIAVLADAALRRLRVPFRRLLISLCLLGPLVRLGGGGGIRISVVAVDVEVLHRPADDQARRAHDQQGPTHAAAHQEALERAVEGQSCRREAAHQHADRCRHTEQLRRPPLVGTLLLHLVRSSRSRRLQGLLPRVAPRHDPHEGACITDARSGDDRSAPRPARPVERDHLAQP